MQSLAMGNCLPSLFPRFYGFTNQFSRSSSSNASSTASTETRSQRQQNSYVNELWEQEMNSGNTLESINEDVNKARMTGLLEQINPDVYNKSSKGDAECAICMVDFENGDPIRYLPCMHSFHMACIDDWLMRSLKCPSCMEPLDSAILSSLTAHTVTNLSSLVCSPATSGQLMKS